MAFKHQNLILTVLETGKFKMKALADLTSNEGLFQDQKQLSAHCVLTWQKG